MDDEAHGMMWLVVPHKVVWSLSTSRPDLYCNKPPQRDLKYTEEASWAWKNPPSENVKVVA